MAWNCTRSAQGDKKKSHTQKENEWGEKERRRAIKPSAADGTSVMSREAAAALMCKLGCLTELLQSRARAKVPTALCKQQQHYFHEWEPPNSTPIRDNIITVIIINGSISVYKHTILFQGTQLYIINLETFLKEGRTMTWTYLLWLYVTIIFKRTHFNYSCLAYNTTSIS